MTAPLAHDDLEQLGALLTTARLGRVHEHHEQIGSTNDRALEWLAAGAPDGALVSADAQTAGRGRLGRPWSSPPGQDIYASVVLRPGAPSAGFGSLALAVGVALCEGLSAVFGDQLPGLALKWPNDVLLGERKLAGILCESRWRGRNVELVIGFGVNVHREAEQFEPGLRGIATSLAQHLDPHQRVGRAAILAVLLHQLELELERFFAGGFAAIRQRYESRCMIMGRAIEVEQGDGQRLAAVAVGLDDDGALRARPRSGGASFRVQSADVWLAPSDQPVEALHSPSGVNVLNQAPGQDLRESHHCSVSREIAGRLELGDQVRIQRSASEYAVYTVVERRDELDPATVRMNDHGLQRLGTNSGFAAELDTIVTRSELTDAQAKSRSEFVERLVDDGVHAGLVVVAAHGGKLEAYTDRQAERVTANLPGVSSWICKGWRSQGGAFDRWHIPSTELRPNSFPGLRALTGRGFAYALSFHGMSRPGILIGGRAPIELRERLRKAIVAAINEPSIVVTVSGSDGPLIGVDANNFVNWLTASGQHGIQIEQSVAARNQYWVEIADAVSAVLGPLCVQATSSRPML